MAAARLRDSYLIQGIDEKLYYVTINCTSAVTSHDIISPDQQSLPLLQLHLPPTL